MKKLFILIIIILASIVFGLYVKQDPGYILIFYKNWVIELSFWTGFIIILLSGFIIYKTILATKFIANLPSKTKGWFKTRAQNKVFYQTSQGLLKLAEGNYKKAEYLLIKSAEGQNKPLINYLTAAKAAQELDDIIKRDEYLKKAFECSPKSGLSIGLMQANLQLSNQENEAALATLKHLQHEYGNNKLILKQLMTVFLNLKDWHSIIKLLPDLDRYKIFNATELFDYEILAAKNYFNAVSNNTVVLNYDQLVFKIHEFYNAYLSKKVRQNHQVVIAYITSLYSAHDKPNANSINIKTELNNFALALIEKTLKLLLSTQSTQAKDQLFQLYGDLASTPEQLVTLEKYLKADPYNINLLFVLGKIAIKHEDYEKAYQYLNQAKKLEEQNKINKTKLPIDYYYAYVLLKLGNQKASLELFNQCFKVFQQA